MKKKEELLSFNNKVAFIFAHSALKEGWDNPNVFQICTLNQTVSEIKRRQEIGRGLRLSVNQQGERIEDEQVNVLTVIANESYESFASNLQREYLDSGDIPPAKLKPKRDNAKRRNVIFKSNDFQDFWKKISTATSYKIRVDTEKLVKQCTQRLANATFPEPIITISKGKFIITEFHLKLNRIDELSANINLLIKNTNNEEYNKENITVNNKTNLEKIDKRLRGFKVNNFVTNQTDKHIEFANGYKLSLFKPLIFTSEEGQKPQHSKQKHAVELYPVFNFIERSAYETGITKDTLFEIFKKLPEAKRILTFKNPEGFTVKFIEVIKNTLADHIANNLEFTFRKGTSTFDIEKIFPEEVSYVQREVIDSNEKGLYNEVQIDSNVEKNFVENRLHPDDKIIFYFKFPNSFKIRLPRIIGNYAPDWGVVRFDDQGKFKLQLIRETKSTIDRTKLRFSNEARKIICAEKHFGELGVDYRDITDNIPNWHLKAEKHTQSEILDK